MNAQSKTQAIVVAAAIRRYRRPLNSKLSIFVHLLIVLAVMVAFTPAEALTPAFKALVHPSHHKLLDSITLAAKAKRRAAKAKHAAPPESVGRHVQRAADCGDSEACDVSYDATYYPSMQP